MITPRNLSFYGRYTYFRQRPAEVLVAVGADTALLGPFILARLFEPGDTAVTALFMVQHVSLMLAPWVAGHMRGRRAGTMYAVMASLSTPALLAGYFREGYWGLAPLLAISNFAFVTLFIPLRNGMMRANYTNRERGRCYGRLKATAIALSFGFALAGALRLRTAPESIHWMLPVVGITSMLGILLYRRIRVRGERRRIGDNGGRTGSPIAAYGDFLRLLARDPRFRWFQVGFLIYGVGFMFTLPREIDAVSSVLKLDYPLIVLGLYGLTPLLKMSLMPFFGALLDRLGPARTAGVAFSLLIFYPMAVLAMVELESVTMWFVARAIFGIAMAGVELVWTIGPVAFAPPGEAPTYTGAHLFITGFRAAFVPYLGLLVAHAAGSGVFVVASSALLVAVLVMTRKRILQRAFAPQAA